MGKGSKEKSFDVSNSGALRSIDYKLSRAVYDLFKGENMRLIPNFLGLIPYEIYILPGMYLAIFQVLWLGSPNPIQFHLLPHWFAYSIFQLLKGSIKTPRPGCHIPGMKDFIDDSHCSHGHEWQSFPSGHTGIAASLAMGLFMEMMYSDDPHFFEINIKDIKVRRLIAFSGLFVAFMVGIHRVSKGYHSLADSMTGCLIGMCIGFVSWTSLEYFKKLYAQLCAERGGSNSSGSGKEDLCENYKYSQKDDELGYWTNNYNIFNLRLFDQPEIDKAIGVVRIILTIPIMWLTIKFFTKDVFQLASIKH
jgi:membrane-associated phospholipid phosphatase